jgi:benzoyl-CoA reductase/2-hydroxyglutaryl-CoA dehydratase subunit BcrC/BadD/HgdB
LGWLLLDYGDIVVHLFHEDLRQYYRLEELGYTRVVKNASELKEAIKTSNIIKNLLRQLATLRSEKDIPSMEYNDVMRKSVQLSKDALIVELKSTLEDWQKRSER